MKQFILILIFLVLVVQTNGQNNYFNKRYFGDIEVLRSIVICNSDYIMGGAGEGVIGVLNFDSIGNLKKTYFFADSPNYYYFGFGGACIKTIDNRYALAGTEVDINNIADGILIITDSLLNLERKITFGALNNADSTYAFYNVINTKDGGFALIGIKWMGTGLRENILLIKTDRFGNKQWQRTYGNYLMDYGFFIVQTLDGGYLLGGGSTNFNLNNSANATVIKTDSNGTQQWLKYFGGPNNDGNGNVMLSHDSMIYVVTDYAHTYYGSPDYPISNVNIIKLDYNGNLKWDKKIGKPEILGSTWRAKTLNDGCIIATGNYELDPVVGRQVGWIIKASPNGDSLWMRNYEILHQPMALQYLFDVEQTPDKGFVACGNLLDIQLNSQEVWIIKTDSFGCLVPDCHLSGMEELKTASVFIKTYPNPASDVIYLYFNCNEANPKYHVEITDIKGIVKERFDILQKDITFGIGLRNYEPGLYLLYLYDGKQCVKTEKIIVTKI